ncbi:MAG: VOC family protein [Proteobacteria bacterium]|nr:VOC family protein [Pseudomonadota bacterium]
MTDDSPVLTPRLIVSSSADAIAFYSEVFGAKELERYASPEGHIMHAAISIRGAIISLADAHDNWYPPHRPEGSPVLMTLMCDDPDSVAQRAEEHGAKILIPVADRFYGYREGRILDPFGHLWIVSKPNKKMSPDDIQRGVDEFGKQ